jgi:hypothetical protein
MFDDFTIGPACEDHYLDEYEPDPEPIDDCVTDYSFGAGRDRPMTNHNDRRADLSNQRATSLRAALQLMLVARQCGPGGDLVREVARQHFWASVEYRDALRDYDEDEEQQCQDDADAEGDER